MCTILDKLSIPILNVGQFLRPGVALDKDRHLLILPGRPSIHIKQQQLYHFIQAEAPRYHDNNCTCWAAVKRSNQGVGVIEGSYTDYEVNDLLYTGFKFGVDNKKQ